MAPNNAKKYSADEVEPLLMKAQGGDITSRNELLHRFQRLVATLVHVCTTGRPNYWSSYQITFIRMFSKKGTPVEDTAAKLRSLLQSYSKEELFSTGQLAVLQAVEKCETNFASTIVFCFKDLITEMIEDPLNGFSFELQEEDAVNPAVENTIALNLFLESLSEPEWLIAMKIIEGEKVRKKEIPSSLKVKLQKYMGEES